MNDLWIVIVSGAAMAAVVIQHWISTRATSRVFAQADFYARAAQTNSDKLVSKVMAMADAMVYERYRAASQLGVPEGSVPPPSIPEATNGSSSADRSELYTHLRMLREEAARRQDNPGNPGLMDEGPGDPSQ